MTVQYTLVFVLLCVELALYLLLNLIPGGWIAALLKGLSPYLQRGSNAFKVVFGVSLSLIVLVTLLFVESFNKMNEDHRHHEDVAHSRLTSLYAQRNFYLCGFTLFLFFVLNRHTMLLFRVDGLKKKVEELSKQK